MKRLLIGPFIHCCFRGNCIFDLATPSEKRWKTWRLTFHAGVAALVGCWALTGVYVFTDPPAGLISAVVATVTVMTLWGLNDSWRDYRHLRRLDESLQMVAPNKSE